MRRPRSGRFSFPLPGCADPCYAQVAAKGGGGRLSGVRAGRRVATGGSPQVWLVRLALSRPYTFIVLALLILIVSPIVVLRTPTDIFPSVDIPVVAVAWTYTGLNPQETEGRITTPFERLLSATVDNIEHT